MHTHLARTTTRVPPVGVPEEVLVLGEQPGPGLWKVVEGLAYVVDSRNVCVPTPRGMVWRSKQVEAVIAASNEVLGPYSASLRVKDAKPYQSQRGSLKGILPRKVYARWRSLRDKYIGEDPETEKLLPTAAALLLRSRAYRANRSRATPTTCGAGFMRLRARMPFPFGRCSMRWGR